VSMENPKYRRPVQHTRFRNRVPDCNYQKQANLRLSLHAEKLTSNLSKAHETRDSLSSSYSQVVLI